MNRIALLILPYLILQGCAGTSPCRRASKGDIPCQSLKGAAFDSCQAATQRAHEACQAQEFAARKDLPGNYTLPQ